MKVGSLVRLSTQFEHEAGYHTMVGVLLRLPFASLTYMGSPRCLVQWLNGAQTKPRVDALEIIEEPKKVKKD